MHRRIGQIKRQANYRAPDGSLREIKYNRCKTEYDFAVARDMVDMFMESTSWYRCIAIEQALINLKHFGKAYEPQKIKQARLYKKFCELLIGHNAKGISNATLLADKMTRCTGDRFVAVMEECFGRPGEGWCRDKAEPVLKHIDEVDSALEQYQTLQLCDLLTGCVLNALVPTANPWKTAIRQHLAGVLGVQDLLPATWRDCSRRRLEQCHPRFSVWYWRPNT